MKRRKRLLRQKLLFAVLCLAGLAGMFGAYISDDYPADETALAILAQDHVTIDGDMTILSPSVPSETAII